MSNWYRYYWKKIKIKNKKKFKEHRFWKNVLRSYPLFVFEMKNTDYRNHQKYFLVITHYIRVYCIQVYNMSTKVTLVTVNT